MTILVENAETFEYLANDGRWTRNMDQAATFRTSTLAKQSAIGLPIGEFNIIGRFRTSPQVMNLDDGDTVMDVARVVKEEDGDSGVIVRAEVPPPDENGAAPPPAPPAQG